MGSEFVGKMVSMNDSMTQSEWQRTRERHNEIVRLTKIALWIAVASSVMALASVIIALVALSRV